VGTLFVRVSSLPLASHRLCRGGVQGRRRGGGGGGGGGILVLRLLRLLLLLRLLRLLRLLLRRVEVLLLLRLLRRRVQSACRVCVLCGLGVHYDRRGLSIVSHAGRNLRGSLDWPTGLAVLRWFNRMLGARAAGATGRAPAPRECRLEKPGHRIKP